MNGTTQLEILVSTKDVNFYLPKKKVVIERLISQLKSKKFTFHLTYLPPLP